MRPDFSNYTLATFNQTLVQNTDLCTLQTCPLELDGFLFAEMNYIPSLAGNALYAAIFGLLACVQVFYGIRYRTWTFLGCMISGGALEVIGYGARIMIHNNPFDSNAFIIYLCCLTLGPAFITASIYLCLSRIIIMYSPEAARFKPQVYTYLFISSDFVSLMLQSAGGAIASTADTHSTEQEGVHVMVAGLAFQVLSLCAFGSLCLDFYLRLRSRAERFNSDFQAIRSRRSHQQFLITLSLAAIFILIRCIFRCAELSGGFNGSLANSELSFMLLEGVMIIFATSCLTFWHPGRVWGSEGWNAASWSNAEKKAREMFVQEGQSLMQRKTGNVHTGEDGVEMIGKTV